MRSIVIVLLFVFSSVTVGFITSQRISVPKDYTLKKLGSSIIPFKDEKTSLYGFKKTTGEIVIPAEYTFVYDFSDGLAAVNKGGNVKLIDEFSEEYVVVGGKWGYINEKGELIIPLQFDAADLFEDGFAIVEKNGKKTFIDKTGKPLTEFKYDFVNYFSEGLAAVGGGKPLEFTYIDKTGKTVIAHDFSAAGDFYEGRAKVTRLGATYYINKEGDRLR